MVSFEYFPGPLRVNHTKASLDTTFFPGSWNSMSGFATLSPTNISHSIYGIIGEKKICLETEAVSSIQLFQQTRIVGTGVPS